MNRSLALKESYKIKIMELHSLYLAGDKCNNSAGIFIKTRSDKKNSRISKLKRYWKIGTKISKFFFVKIGKFFNLYSKSANRFFAVAENSIKKLRKQTLLWEVRCERAGVKTRQFVKYEDCYKISKILMIN